MEPTRLPRSPPRSNLKTITTMARTWSSPRPITSSAAPAAAPAAATAPTDSRAGRRQITGELRARSPERAGSPHQHRKARKCKAAPGIVNHV